MQTTALEVGRKLKNKLARLQDQLCSYKKVAVAFSDGVDSTLLLWAACDSVGPENVTALHAVSCLIADHDQTKAAHLVLGPNGIGCSYRAVSLEPLHWPEFVKNSEQRCYVCKRRMYQSFCTEIRMDGRPFILVDGTNSDDLQAHRPGLQAIHELSIPIPLAEAELQKKEIRSLAREKSLPNWNQPTNSCLATRIPVHQPITRSLLRAIAATERFLQEKGFAGCRARPVQRAMVIQVMHQDLKSFSSFMEQSSGRLLMELLNSFEFTQIAIEEKGRIFL